MLASVGESIPIFGLLIIKNMLTNMEVKNMKLFVYNFYGDIYETTEAFDDTYRAKKREAEANGEPFSRQVIDGDKITSQHYVNGIWLDD